MLCLWFLIFIAHYSFLNAKRFGIPEVFQLSDGLYKEINTHKCALNRIPHGCSSALAMDAPGYSSSTILTAVACLGAVCAGLYVVWGPEHFFRRRGNSSQSTRHSQILLVTVVYMHAYNICCVSESTCGL